jgi:uncharacterized protein (TIGR02145 family)
MKTKIFFFTMLASATASAQVTNVAPISANYANKTVSFRVWWNAGSRDATHLSKVWVWVDYIKVNSNNTTSGNTWTRATVGTITGGTTALDGSNQKGFWLEGNASTNYSATLTVQLTNVPDKFNWCAYVSDFPPNMIMDGQTYYFKGTLPFILKEANGTTHEITQKSMPKANLTFVPVSITDKTECPGGLKEVIGTCPYTGADWYADPNHKCQQRTSGAKNWEAWIKDTRDNELYRIVYMPNGIWWTAEEIRYDASATSQSYKCPNCTHRTIYNRPIIACPAQWVLPTVNQFLYLHSIATDLELIDANTYPYVGTGTDKFGFSVIPDPSRGPGSSNSVLPTTCVCDTYRLSTSWESSDGGRFHAISPEAQYNWYSQGFPWNQVRCIRQL